MVDNNDFKWKTNNTNKIIKIFMSLREGTSLAQTCVFWNLLNLICYIIDEDILFQLYIHTLFTHSNIV